MLIIVIAGGGQTSVKPAGMLVGMKEYMPGMDYPGRIAGIAAVKKYFTYKTRFNKLILHTFAELIIYEPEKLNQ